jgi:hypothetical protein
MKPPCQNCGRPVASGPGPTGAWLCAVCTPAALRRQRLARQAEADERRRQRADAKLRRQQQPAEWQRIVHQLALPAKRTKNMAQFIPALMERDRGQCQLVLCFYPDRAVSATTGLGRPSADHIIPWSVWRPTDGPTPDCLDNLQLAHLRCNIAKGTQFVGETYRPA